MTGRLLLVDDEPDFLALAAAWLGRRGHAVVTATTGAEAREAFARTPPDMVLLDLVMPPERTPEAGLALIPAFASVPVVVLTAHAGDPALALRAVAAGAWDFLAKPVDPDLLAVVVERALVKRRLEREVANLRATGGDDGLVGPSAALAQVRELVRRLAPTELPVVIQGPSGSGKELVARALHARGPRAGGPFVPVHCGAIPAELQESELFGHLKGSFTGAHRDREGLVAAARGGTLFLDELGEMPPSLQVKLLRVLQEGLYTPVGATTPREADVRVVSATHRDLAGLVAAGAFREDLFYRLKGVMLRVPPLAERREDILPLALHFLDADKRLSEEARSWLLGRPWPGNARELKAAVTAASALAEAAEITVDDLLLATGGAAPSLSDGAASRRTLADSVDDTRRREITRALAAREGNTSAAARDLGLSRVGLIKMMGRLGLR
jgi:two-component system NtrC family response regulator